MKSKLMIRLLLLAGLLSGFAPVAQAFYNPSAGRWLSRDPIGERRSQSGNANRKGQTSTVEQQNLCRFVNNDPLSSIDPRGLDVYKIVISADLPVVGSMVDHREIVGDDGKGGVYVLSFNQCAKCGVHIGGASVIGGGEVTVTTAPNISAEDWIKENGGKIKRRVVTPHSDVDKAMSDIATAYGKTKPDYVLGFQDCGTIANRFMEEAERAVSRWDDRVGESFPPDF